MPSRDRRLQENRTQARRPTCRNSDPGDLPLRKRVSSLDSQLGACKTRRVRGPTGRGSVMAGTPVVFIHGLWLHADSWASVGRAVSRCRLRPAGAGLAGRLGDRRGDSRQRRCRRRSRDQRRGRPLRRGRAGASRAARSRRPFLRWPDRAAPDRAGARSGRRRDRPGPDQGRPGAAGVGAQGRLDRAQEPVEQEQGRLADRRAVPVRVRQRAPRRRVERSVRALDDPVTREAALRGGVRELRAEVTGAG